MGDLQKILAIVGEARRRLFRILIVLGPMFGFFVTFRLDPIDVPVLGRSIPLAYPWPSLFSNVSAQVFLALRAYLLPPSVTLINTGIGDAVVVQLEVALLLTLIFGMPWVVHEIGAFLVPALRTNERELLRRIGIPATVLFAAGTALGFLYLTPLTFRLLFQYVAAMGLLPYLNAQAFVTFALLYSLAFGVVFELPVFVYTLTRLGVVRAGAWTKHWRGAVIGALVFGMVITPDNSGITMLLVATPMIGLYLGGAWFARRWEARHRPRSAAGGA